MEIRAVLNKTSVAEDERIEITPPPDDNHIGPCSIDLRLGDDVARLRSRPWLLGFLPFDPAKGSAAAAQNNWYKFFKISDKGIRLRPNETLIALTKERVRLPRGIFGLITGRSSYSRMGLEVHLTQDLRQPGHAGHILLQLKNNAPFAVKVYPGMRIAQIMLARLGVPCQTGYDQAGASKYKGEADGIATKWFLDEELKGRELISRHPPIEQFLNSWLMILAAISAWTLFQADANKTSTTALLIATAVVLLLRIFSYFRAN